MNWSFSFFVTSFMLGIALAMDAFSVSIANGLNEPHMSLKRMNLIAGTFGFFQALMPMLGWALLHTLLTFFEGLQRYIPWIALILLIFLGGKMIWEAVHGDGEEESPAVGIGGLLLQGIATSIDALSVGLTIAEYTLLQALTASLIISVVTYVICIGGLHLGKAFAARFSRWAPIVGGVILIIIGIHIFIKSFL